MKQNAAKFIAFLKYPSGFGLVALALLSVGYLVSCSKNKNEVAPEAKTAEVKIQVYSVELQLTDLPDPSIKESEIVFQNSIFSSAASEVKLRLTAFSTNGKGNEFVKTRLTVSSKEYFVALPEEVEFGNYYLTADAIAKIKKEAPAGADKVEFIPAYSSKEGLKYDMKYKKGDNTLGSGSMSQNDASGGGGTGLHPSPPAPKP